MQQIKTNSNPNLKENQVEFIINDTYVFRVSLDKKMETFPSGLTEEAELPIMTLVYVFKIEYMYSITKIQYKDGSEEFDHIAENKDKGFAVFVDLEMTHGKVTVEEINMQSVPMSENHSLQKFYDNFDYQDLVVIKKNVNKIIEEKKLNREKIRVDISRPSTVAMRLEKTELHYEAFKKVLLGLGTYHKYFRDRDNFAGNVVRLVDKEKIVSAEEVGTILTNAYDAKRLFHALNGYELTTFVTKFMR